MIRMHYGCKVRTGTSTAGVRRSARGIEAPRVSRMEVDDTVEDMMTGNVATGRFVSLILVRDM